MWKLIAAKKKGVGAALSAALFATAFTEGGCTITVDEDAVNQVISWLDQLDYSGMPMPGPDEFMNHEARE